MFRTTFAAALLVAQPLFAQGQPNLVLNLEGYLQELGFNPGVVDGQIDQGTYAAISAYQAARGLPVTGGMTVPEYQALEAEALAARQANAPAAKPVLSTIAPPKTAEDITYFEIETCPQERGMGVVKYSFATNARTLLALTDICWDRSTGAFSALEPMSGLTLVRNVDATEFYEVVASGQKAYQRKKLNLGKYRSDIDPATYGAVGFGYQDNRDGRRLVDAYNHSIGGFITETSFAPDKLEGPITLWVSGSDSLDQSTRNDGARFGSQTAYFAFQGDMTFENGVGTTTLKDSGEGDGQGTGTLTLKIDPTGRIEGTGSFLLQNGRLAGVNPEDWKTTNWNVLRMIGMTAGSDGQEIRAVGIATGVTIDHDGTQTPVYASVSVVGYGPKFAAE